MSREGEAVSGEPKTLTLTLADFLAELTRRGWEYKFDSRAFLKHQVLTPAHVHTGREWPEAASAAFGVPVVARDEAAELRAAAEEALEAIAAQQRDPAYHSAYLLLQRAARRLRAALATSEGRGEP